MKSAAVQSLQLRPDVDTTAKKEDVDVKHIESKNRAVSAVNRRKSPISSKSNSKKQYITDGPYAETKEMLG